jgi:histidinol-phosphate aminotransferase
MLRPDLRGRTPYGAPQLDVPVALNTNENSYAVPPVVVAAMTDAVADVAAGLNRYPDREFTALREALARYLSRSGTEVTAPEVWAGNGSNEVLLHLLQAFWKCIVEKVCEVFGGIHLYSKGSYAAAVVKGVGFHGAGPA